VADANSLKRELAPYPQQLQVHISGKLENGERVVAGLFRGRPIRSCVDVKIKRGMVYCQLLLLFSVNKASKALVRLFADDFGPRHPNLKLAGLRPLKRLKKFEVVDLTEIAHHVHILPDGSAEDDPEAFILNPHVDLCHSKL